jgi:hypothetical protein
VPETLVASTFSPTSALSSAPSLIRIGTACPTGQYLDAVSCTCLCHIQYCPSRQYYQNDPKYTCGCR